MARMSEQAERYEDMVTYMSRVANMGSELSLEERNLLSVAFKNSVGARRQAFRSIASMMTNQVQSGVPVPPCVQEYKSRVEEELKGKCTDILNLIAKPDGGLMATASSSEAQVFYKKMEGDYYRYLAEFAQDGDSRAQTAQNAYTAYSQATSLAGAMSAMHPIRLGLALNFSVFYFEVYQKAPDACMLAKAAFTAAQEEITANNLDPNSDSVKDAMQILQLLRDNLTLWEQESAPAGDGRPPEQDGTLCEDL